MSETITINTANPKFTFNNSNLFTSPITNLKVNLAPGYFINDAKYVIYLDISSISNGQTVVIPVKFVLIMNETPKSKKC